MYDVSCASASRSLSRKTISRQERPIECTLWRRHRPQKTNMESGLKNKIALLTGSSDGIGRAAAHAFAAEGVMLALCSRTETKLRKTAEEIESKYGVEVLAEAVDV